MHELKIIQDIFPIIEKAAQANRLKSINNVCVKTGKLRQVVPEFLQFAFENVAKNTIVDGAKLQIELITITAQCKNCHKQFTVDENTYICPYCDNANLEILTGKEIILEKIEGKQ